MSQERGLIDKIIESLRSLFGDSTKRLDAGPNIQIDDVMESSPSAADVDTAKPGLRYVARSVESSQVIGAIEKWANWTPGGDGGSAVPSSNVSIQGIGFSGKTTFLHEDVIKRIDGINAQEETRCIIPLVIDSQVAGCRKDTLEVMLEIRAKLHALTPPIPTNQLDYALHSYAIQRADQNILKLNLLDGAQNDSCRFLRDAARGGLTLSGVIDAASTQLTNDASSELEDILGKIVKDPAMYIGSPQSILSALLSGALSLISDQAIIHVLYSACIVPAMGLTARSIRTALKHRNKKGKGQDGTDVLKEIADAIDCMTPDDIVPCLVYWLVYDLAIALQKGNRVLLAFDTAECLMGKLPSGWAYASPWAEVVAQTPFAFTLFVGRELPSCLCGKDEACRVNLADGSFGHGEAELAGFEASRTICNGYGIDDVGTIERINKISGGVPGIVAMLCSSLSASSSGLAATAPVLSEGQANYLANKIGDGDGERTARAIREVVRVTTRDLSSIDRQALYKVAWLQSWQPDMVRFLMPESRSYPMALSVVDGLPYVSDAEGAESAGAHAKKMHGVIRSMLQDSCDQQTVDYLAIQLAEQYMGEKPTSRYKSDALGALVLLEAKRLRDVLSSEPAGQKENHRAERSAEQRKPSERLTNIVGQYSKRENGREDA